MAVLPMACSAPAEQVASGVTSSKATASGGTQQRGVDAEILPLAELTASVLGTDVASASHTVQIIRQRLVTSCLEARGFPDLHADPIDLVDTPPRYVAKDYLFKLDLKNPNHLNARNPLARSASYEAAESPCVRGAESAVPDPFRSFKSWMNENGRELDAQTISDPAYRNGERTYEACLTTTGYTIESSQALRAELIDKANGALVNFMSGQSDRESSSATLRALALEESKILPSIFTCEDGMDRTCFVVRSQHEQAFLELHRDAIVETLLKGQKDMKTLMSLQSSN